MTNQEVAEVLADLSLGVDQGAVDLQFGSRTSLCAHGIAGW